jgi:hypothetical protein
MECSGCRARHVSGGNSGGEPPVPIPNTEVKPACADGTWGVGPRESRSPPGFLEGPPAGRPLFASAGRHRYDAGGVSSKQPRRRRPSRAGREEKQTGAGRRRPAVGGDGSLPNWVVSELARVTPKAQLRGAVVALTRAAVAAVEGHHQEALNRAEEAKRLSPRDATVRELIGLSAYRLGRWEQALRELRTFRRLTGETTHLPVEMDVLRALQRPQDVESAWALLQRLGGSPATEDEGKVVFASYLLDADRTAEAWEVAKPGRITVDAPESRFRVWYVAARAAARLGDRETALRLYEAISRGDPAFPGLDELRAAIG